MAIFASSSTITTQTVPLIIVDPATINENYFLVWDAAVGAFVAKIPDITNFNIDLSSANVTGVLPPEKGGLGVTEYDKGDMLYADVFNGSIVLRKLPIGFNSSILTSVDGIPQWSNNSDTKNMLSSRSANLETTSVEIESLLPDNSQLVRITLIVIEPYNIEASFMFGTTQNPADILLSSQFDLTREGRYIYAVDNFYTNSVKLLTSISDATIGSSKIIVEFIAQ